VKQFTHQLHIATHGQGLYEFTSEIDAWVRAEQGQTGLLTVFCQHTSASLVIQENADPDVCTDLTTALERLAPSDAGWVHDTEGPDDMQAHVKTMLTGVSLQIPVMEGALALGTWQGIYLVEHRAQKHRREIVLQFIGSRR
jgi:secondary thiamine-phosphate synthase enzyme